MKNIRNKNGVRFICLLLVLVCISTAFISCAEEKKEVPDPIFVCGDSEMPLYFYEYMLSLKRGELASAKNDVESKRFWETLTDKGISYEEHFNAEVLDSCRRYFVAAHIFDESGYELSSATMAEIDESLEFLLDYDADGDENKFNEIIDDFGITYEQLRECYVILAKRDALISVLYGSGGSLIADSLKNQYYKENYHRFKQILVRNYYYEYQTDDWGQEIYFDTETGKALYDKENGEIHFDEDGAYVRDNGGEGEVIYFGDDDKPLYNKEKGQRAAKLDEDGSPIKHEYTAEQMAERAAYAEELARTIAMGDYTSFEAVLAEIQKREDLGDSYPEGYYVSDVESANYGSYSYMNGILDTLKTMDEGEVKLHISEYGYHVIMKYELDDGRFADGEYAEWFDLFTSSLISEMLKQELDKVMGDILVNEENLAKAKSITEIGTNFDY